MEYLKNKKKDIFVRYIPKKPTSFTSTDFLEVLGGLFFDYVV